jgi:hypothetical protein
MSNYIQAELASWSTMLTADGQGFTGKVTKVAMKRTLVQAPRKVEFCAIASPFQKGGYFFIDEVAGSTIELRYNNGRDLMVIEVDDNGRVYKVR